MPNRHGAPIWYELITPDPDGAKAFYDAVAGWTIEARPSGPADYRMIGTPAGLLGGVLRLDDDMRQGGATPVWLLYVGVADVDACVEQARGLGGHVFVPPTDIPGVGRFSMLGDPQGAPFYVMRGASEEISTVFAPDTPGRCGWNELWTPDIAASLAFYGPLFGWENRETMDMGPMGGYHFLDLGETRLGAVTGGREERARWNLYFNVADLDHAMERIGERGGRIEIGPHDVPSGNRIVLGVDPQGAHFALVAPQKQ